MGKDRPAFTPKPTRSLVVIAICLAHALLVRFSLIVDLIPSVQAAIHTNQQPYLVAETVAKVLLIGWLAWPIALWWLVDWHRRFSVPAAIIVGLVCLGSDAVVLELIVVAWLVVPGHR
jgi:hypothetical protein